MGTWIYPKTMTMINPDRVVSGTFRGQGPSGSIGPVDFRIKGSDVVVTKPDGSFVSILRNGVNNNGSVMRAIERSKGYE